MQDDYFEIATNEVAKINSFCLKNNRVHEDIAKGMCYLYRYGKRDYERGRGIDRETLTNMFIEYVKDHSIMDPLQQKTLERYASEWASKAYSDGLNSQK